METKITGYDVKSAGSFTINTNNGEINSIPTSYSFRNDISSGEISNSIKRIKLHSLSEDVSLNYNVNVNGTSQMSSNGCYEFVGSRRLQDGYAQRAASSINDDLYALIAQYPNRNTGEPIWNPLPNLTECAKKAEKVTAAGQPVELPTIKVPSDIGKWAAAWTAHMGQQLTANRTEQMQVAAQMVIEEKDAQIKEQKKYLTEKYGEEIYNLYFKTNVEAGAIYTIPNPPYSIERKDVVQALIGSGGNNLAEKRNAYTKELN